MDIEEMLEIHDCPLCDGGSLLEEESGCGYCNVSGLWMPFCDH